MKAGQEISDTTVRPLVESLATMGVSIFDRCPCIKPHFYLSALCRITCGSLALQEVFLDMVRSYEVHLTRKKMAAPDTPWASRELPLAAPRFSLVGLSETLLVEPCIARLWS